MKHGLGINLLQVVTYFQKGETKILFIYKRFYYLLQPCNNDVPRKTLEKRPLYYIYTLLKRYIYKGIYARVYFFILVFIYFYISVCVVLVTVTKTPKEILYCLLTSLFLVTTCYPVVYVCNKNGDYER